MGRRALASVAGGVLGNFVSRNNDLDGYWALGRLRAACEARGVEQLSLDLLSGAASLDDAIAGRVAAAYREVLAAQLRGLGLPIDLLRTAKVVLSFAPDEGKASDPFAPYGGAFRCSLTLVDDHGRSYSHMHSGHCGAHDPQRERKSTRA